MPNVMHICKTLNVGFHRYKILCFLTTLLLLVIDSNHFTCRLIFKKITLSLFYSYENLKPPTSPSPTAPGNQGDSSNADATSELTSDVQSASIGPATDVTNTTSIPHQVSTERPLSPYVV